MKRFDAKRAILPLSSFVPFIFVSYLHAAQVTVGFVGTVDLIDEGVCMCLGEAYELLGQPVVGYYTYDTEATDTNPNVGRGSYTHTVMPYELHAEIGPYVFGTDPSDVGFTVYIQDAPAGGAEDLYWATSTKNLVDPFYYVDNTPVQLVAVRLFGDENALDSEALPVAPPDLSDWSDAQFAIHGPNFEYAIYATITWMGAGDPTAVSPKKTPSFLSIGPNPFSSQTTFRFGVESGGPTILRIYDVAGRLVRSLDARNASPGSQYEIPWNGRDEHGAIVPTGVYFVDLVTPSGRVTKKMTVLK